ncbi:MAG: amidohydrolase [Thermoanaerobaculia bacterium]|nr:amidohydrolase [Thermoanaerobaculia bacterium]
MSPPSSPVGFRPTPSLTLSAVLVVCGFAACGEPAAPPVADRLFVGAPVYTVDAALPWAEAVAVANGRIVYVGEEGAARRLVGETTEIVELAGGMVLPAFQDAHIHPVMSGVEIGRCDLSVASDRAALFDTIRACAERQSGEWLIGFGWELPIFPDANPRAEWLDEIVPGRPVYLASADGHSAWVSSPALELAGIDRETPDPPRGRIERDPVTGEPSGTLREAAADLVEELVPPAPLEERLQGLLLAQERLLTAGVSAVQDASTRREYLEAYRRAEATGRLDLRVVAALWVDPERGVEQVDDLAALRDEFSSPAVRPTAAKLFLDGVIEARTALMLEPYSDRPGYHGVPEWDRQQLLPVVARLVEEGFDLHFHAIGDGAVRLALDAVEATRGIAEVAPGSAAAQRRPRHHVAHLEVIHPDDLSRFAVLEVGADFQPLWAQADTYIVDLTWPALGPERSRWLYPIGSVHRAGGRLVFGSDWSVSSLDPLDGIEVALTRRSVDGSTEALLPGEAIDLATALEAYTLGAAWANGLDGDSGSLEVGKRADLVVLDQNLFELPSERLAEAEVVRTVIAGADVYRIDESTSRR